MKIVITGDLGEENYTADPDESTGMTDRAHGQIISLLIELGFDDIEVQAHDEDGS